MLAGAVMAALPAAALTTTIAFNKSPAYFVTHFGLPRSSQDVTQWEFSRRDGTRYVLVRKFSVRTYRRNDVEIEAVFWLPYLTLAAVTYRHPPPWARDELNGLLSLYGSGWSAQTDNRFASNEGAWALLATQSLTFLSPQLLGEMEMQEAGRTRP